VCQGWERGGREGKGGGGGGGRGLQRGAAHRGGADWATRQIKRAQKHERVKEAGGGLGWFTWFGAVMGLSPWCGVLFWVSLRITGGGARGGRRARTAWGGIAVFGRKRGKINFKKWILGLGGGARAGGRARTGGFRLVVGRGSPWREGLAG